MKLIVTEKNIAAKKLAEILAVGKPKAEKVYSTPVYTFRRDGEDWMSIGLKGHILGVDFPPQMKFEDGTWEAVWDEDHRATPATIPATLPTPPWEKRKKPFTVDGIDLKTWKLAALPYLVWAPVGKMPAERELIRSLKNAAKKADSIVIATDFDREGELIGSDAAALVRDVNKKAPITRARFSAITKDEVERAFAELVEVDECLAQAGESRQDIDLVWGAVLTRYLTMAKFSGYGNVKSAGRVQTPTLALIVARELEREAFVPEIYWQIKGAFRSKGTDAAEFSAGHATDRFKSEAEAKRAMEAVAAATVGTVTTAEKKRRKVAPPTPFNTTALQAAAASEGITPGRTMRIAESLYMDGLISYPRVDNTVYPPSLDLGAILNALSDVPFYREHVAGIKKAGALHPTRGAKETTDHPPITPTAAADPDKLKPEQWKLYNLIARRFLATLSDAAIIEGTKVTIDVAGEPFVAKGDILVTPGFRGIYPYGLKKDEQLPPLSENDSVDFLGADLAQKQTEPPARYSQGKLIQEMEKRGSGHQGDAPRDHRAPHRGALRGQRAARAHLPGTRGHRGALHLRAAHHHAGHDLGARSRDGRDRQRAHRPHRRWSATRASCWQTSWTSSSRRRPSSARSSAPPAPTTRRWACVPSRGTICSSSSRSRRAGSSSVARGGRSATSPTRCRRARSRRSTRCAPSAARRRSRSSSSGRSRSPSASIPSAPPTTSPRSASVRARRAPRPAEWATSRFVGVRRASATCAAPTTTSAA